MDIFYFKTPLIANPSGKKCKNTAVYNPSGIIVYMKTPPGRPVPAFRVVSAS